MRLLVITQKVDVKDPALGFFHRWLEKFSQNYEMVTVICLEKGEFNLPKNVNVLSLGKEKNRSRIQYIVSFFAFLWNQRNNYDSVFVHMNQEYVLLGGLLWQILGKKIYFWRNHPHGGVFTEIAAFFCKKIFCTSKYAFVAKFKNSIIMPVGIDIDLFKSKNSAKKDQKSILYLGRISPIKKIHVLLGALAILEKKGVDFSAKIVGDALPQDRSYLKKLIKLVLDFGLNEKVSFESAVPNSKAADYYNSSILSVNLTPTGSMDKTIFEAMACGQIVVLCNKSLCGEIEEKFMFKEDDSKDLSEKIENALLIGKSQENYYSAKLREYVLSKHSLNELADRLSRIIGGENNN